MKNIEMFDIFVGRIFAELYESFPVRVPIEVCEIARHDLDEDMLVLPKPCEIAHDTVVWLEQSGYITYRSDDQYSFSDVCLSARGLELLKATPRSITRKDGIGEEIAQMVKMGKDEAVRKAVGMVLAMGARAVDTVITGGIT